jgi:hypothetical protein
MIDNGRLILKFGPLALLGIALSSPGCGQALGPVPLAVTRVQGRVSEGPRPVTGGWIEFYPVDGTVGDLRSARLRPDGSFEADRVAVGLNLVRLVNVHLEAPGAERLFGAYSSPIRRVIPAEQGRDLSIDVVDELLRFQNSRTRRPRSGAPAPGESR